MKRAARQIAAALLAAPLAACASPTPDPRYRPTESVLEVVAVLRRHVPDDTYRFEPARDFTGRNVYRSTLLRLENLERVHAEALRAGQLNDVIDFSKGRALERLRAYELAAAAYLRAAEPDGPLRHEALRSAALCEALAEAASLGWEPQPPGDPAPTSTALSDPDRVLADFEKRLALLDALAEENQATHYAAVVAEEIERADVARARFFVARRQLVPHGNVRALSELQRVVARHRDSKSHNAHLLALADLYATLSNEYVESRPPASLGFDPAVFQELVESAARLYETVANQDGTPEKLEASRRLEAFLAFTLRVDRDRFSP